MHVYFAEYILAVGTAFRYITWIHVLPHCKLKSNCRCQPAAIALIALFLRESKRFVHYMLLLDYLKAHEQLLLYTWTWHDNTYIPDMVPKLKVQQLILNSIQTTSTMYEYIWATCDQRMWTNSMGILVATRRLFVRTLREVLKDAYRVNQNVIEKPKTKILYQLISVLMLII